MSKGLSECFDAAVVGAGPAGCTAARALAAAGRSVLLLDKAALPRYKTCGGGLLARACQWLPPGAEEIAERRFHSVTLNFTGTPLSFTITRPQPLVYMTMRADLDHLLAQAAKAAGAQLIQSCTVKGLETQPDRVRILTNNGDFSARFVIAADGVHSPTARLAGWPAISSLAPALEHEVFLEDGEFKQFSAVPRFDFDAIERGYAWVFPKREHLSVGIMTTRKTSPDLPARLADYLRRIGIQRIRRSEPHGYLIPLAPRPGPPARGRILLAGDAAGLADPITAEGISHALLSGHLAAQALIESNFAPGHAAALYQSLLQQRILGELRAARFLARVLYCHPKIRNRIFARSGQSLCEFVGRVVMGETSYRQALRRPANYLRLLGWP